MTMDKVTVRAEFERRQTLEDAQSLFGNGVDWEAGGSILGTRGTGDTWTDPDYQSNVTPDGRRKSLDRRSGLMVETDPRAALAAFAMLPPKIEKACRNALSKKFLEPVVRELQRRTPVDTGLMQSKITRRLGRSRRRQHELFAVIGVPEQVYFQRDTPKTQRKTIRETETAKERRERLRKSVVTRDRAKKDKYAEGSKKTWTLGVMGFQFSGYTRGQIRVRGRYHRRYTIEADGTYRANVSEQRKQKLRKEGVWDRYYDGFHDVGGKVRKKMGVPQGQSIRLRQRMPAVEMFFLEYGTKKLTPRGFVRETYEATHIETTLENEMVAQMNLTIQDVQREMERRGSKGGRR